jgi:hypothetical protein
MQFNLAVANGKVTNGGKQIQDYLKTLSGIYTVDIQEVNTMTTTKECRNAYFFKVDLVVAHSGDERYDIHKAFKEHSKIKSTKEFSVVDWKNFINLFREYIYENYDILV